VPAGRDDGVGLVHMAGHLQWHEPDNGRVDWLDRINCLKNNEYIYYSNLNAGRKTSG